MEMATRTTGLTASQGPSTADATSPHRIEPPAEVVSLTGGEALAVVDRLAVFNGLIETDTSSRRGPITAYVRARQGTGLRGIKNQMTRLITRKPRRSLGVHTSAPAKQAHQHQRPGMSPIESHNLRSPSGDQSRPSAPCLIARMTPRFNTASQVRIKAASLPSHGQSCPSMPIIVLGAPEGSRGPRCTGMPAMMPQKNGPRTTIVCDLPRWPVGCSFSSS